MQIELSDSSTQSNSTRLRKADIPLEPFTLFTTWFGEAKAANVYQYDAVNLATATRSGRPSNRFVLMRGFDPRGFCFYTNYESRKGQELDENPLASMNFWWGPMGRQVRIEGQIEKLTGEESDAYYQSRLRQSRLVAWISEQSQIVPSRGTLEHEYETLVAKYADEDPPRPPFWGGYRLMPDRIEFWQEGQYRLHDRLCYQHQDDGTWQVERLAP